MRAALWGSAPFARLVVPRRPPVGALAVLRPSPQTPSLRCRTGRYWSAVWERLGGWREDRRLDRVQRSFSGVPSTNRGGWWVTFVAFVVTLAAVFFFSYRAAVPSGAESVPASSPMPVSTEPPTTEAVPQPTVVDPTPASVAAAGPAPAPTSDPATPAPTTPSTSAAPSTPGNGNNGNGIGQGHGTNPPGHGKPSN
jgi:hypothetical protein